MESITVKGEILLKDEYEIIANILVDEESNLFQLRRFDVTDFLYHYKKLFSVLEFPLPTNYFELTHTIGKGFEQLTVNPIYGGELWKIFGETSGKYRKQIKNKL